MNITVLLFLLKSRVIVKGIASRMLQDQDASLTQQASRHTRRIKDPVGNGIQPFYLIGRISEYDVKVQTADIQEIEDVVPDDMHSGYSERSRTALDKGSVEGIHLDCINLLRTPRGKFIRYASGP